MEDEKKERTRILMGLNDVIGKAGFEKANELSGEGHEIDLMDIVSAFIFCAYRTVCEVPKEGRAAAYVEAISYLCMIAENETEEEVFKLIFDVLDGYIKAKKSSPNEETENIPVANGKNHRS